MTGIQDHLEKLIGFKGVADLQSFHKAAARLNVSQPSLSSSIKILESVIGQPLFLRSHKGVSLTAEGAVLLEFTNKLLQDIRDLEAKLSTNSSELVGNLRVGLYESIAIYFWPTFFKEFRALHPRLGLSLTTGRSGALLERLEQQELDIVVTVEPKMSRKLRATTLYSDVYEFYASSEILDRLKPVLREGVEASTLKAAFADIPLILFSSASNHQGQPLEQSLIEAGINLGQFYEVESFEAAKEIAANQIGVALLPTRVAKSYVDAGKLSRLEIPGFSAKNLDQHNVCMVILEKSADSRPVTAVTSALVEHFAG